MDTLLAAARRTSRHLPGWLLLVLLAVLVLMPIGMLLYTSLSDVVPRPGSSLAGGFTLEWYADLLSPAVLDAAGTSLTIGVGGTAIALFFGATMAWLAARTDVPAKWLAQLAGIVPMFVSALVGALAWSFLGAPEQGFINIIMESLGIPLRINIYSVGGIIAVFGLYYAPYSFLMIYSALSLMNPELEEAARTHRASAFQTLRSVTLPLAMPAIAGSTLLTFALIVENFPVAQLLGTPAGETTLPSFIFRLMYTAPPRTNEAATIGILLSVIVAVMIYFQRRMLARRDYTTVSGKGLRPHLTQLGRWRWPALAFIAVYLLIAVVLPFFALLQMGLRTQPYIESAADFFNPDHFGLHSMREVIGYPPFEIGITNSLIIGFLAALLGGLLHFVMAFTVARSRFPGRQAIEYLATSPVAIPAIVFGLGFLWTWFAIPVPLYGTTAIIVLAYTVRFMPQGFGNISASLRQVHKDMEESALVSGATKARTGAEITLPLIRTSVISAMLLLLILSLRELSLALFLFTSSTRTLSIVIYDFWNSGVFARAAAASLIYSLVLLVIVVIARRWLGLKQLG